MLHVRGLIAAGPLTGKEPPPWRESFSMNAGAVPTNWSCYDLDYILGIAGEMCAWALCPKGPRRTWLHRSYR